MSYKFSGLDHAQVSAPKGCEEDARRFFGEILGMTEIEKPEELRKRGGCWFQAGAQQIHIGVEEDFRPAKKAHPAFYVENLMGLRERVLAHGLQVKDDNANPGVRRFFMDDPWGNRLEFTENSNGR